MSLRRHPGVALALLTALNFFNYIDRYVLPSVQPLVQKELHRSDADMGWLTSVFFAFYMCVAPFMGVLAHRYPRKILIATGAVLWSGATLLTAVTTDYTSLLIRHTLVGIGEAQLRHYRTGVHCRSLSRTSPRAHVIDLLSCHSDGHCDGIRLGGHLGPVYGWRAPFMVAAIPGFLLAAALAFIPEPKRGNADVLTSTPERSTIVGLFHNPAYWTATLGTAMMTFALGGLSVWMPTFLSRVRGLPLNDANILFGEALIVAGFIATDARRLAR